MDEIPEVGASLLRNLRVPPKDGYEAAERHILLAVRFHRAAGLNQIGHGDGKGWRRYFEEHFPKRPEWDPGDADRLWEHWRLGLVKWETPRSGVTMTHGQPEAHWFREPGGTLCVNLESMWDDFEASVHSFVELLRRDDARRVEAVGRWRKRAWTVRRLQVSETDRTYGFDFAPSASAAASATVMSPPPDAKWE